MTTISRLVLHETKDRLHTTRDVAAVSGVAPNVVRSQVAELNDRIKATLGYSRSAIEVDGAGTWRVDGVAGLLRLNDRVEIEVVPKFLDPTHDSWRSDFFLLAVFVRTGHLLVADEISSSVADRGDLATLIARTLLRLHKENERRPIRGYRRTSRTDFSFDGDVEWDSIVLPESDGFVQHKLELTRRNVHNAVLKAAVDTLIPEVGEGDARAQLLRLTKSLGSQPVPPKALPRLAPRHRAWSGAYTLSQLVIDGMGLDLASGSFTGPGFVLPTWSAWESLCEEVVRRAMSGYRTVGQHPYRLGRRRTGTEVFAKPDIAVLDTTGPLILLDAKYKTRQGREPRINSTDLYEGLAFLRSAQASRIVLLYPALDRFEELESGEWKFFDEVSVDDLRVQAAQLQMRGLSERGGFDRLVRGARDALDGSTNFPPVPHKSEA